MTRLRPTRKPPYHEGCETIEETSGSGLLRPSTLRHVLDGQWMGCASVDTAESAATGIGIDSRTLQEGEIFFAIRGRRFDGHDFLDCEAVRRAPVAVVDDASRGASLRGDAATLLVADTTVALGALAAAHRDVLQRSGCRVIAVCGSNGKTTTRHLVHAVLSSFGRGTQSPRSFNNHIGVPLTLLAARPGDAFVVVEVGTNHPGEIDALARLVRPDAAILTSIGSEHLASFGDVAGVAREETSIFRWVDPQGLAVIPAACPAHDLVEKAVDAVASVVRIGCDLAAVELQPRAVTQRVTLEDGLQFDLRLPGRHNVDNALCAVATARWFGMADSQVADALGRAEPVPGRSDVQQYGSPTRPVTVFDDSYNANPDSVRAAMAALAVLSSAEPSRRCVVVLGDMLELGEAAEAAHRDLTHCFEVLASRSVVAVFVGPLMRALAVAVETRSAMPCRHVPTPEPGALERIAEEIEAGDIVLVKASRGMALERVVEGIAGRFPRRASTASGATTVGCGSESNA